MYFYLMVMSVERLKKINSNLFLSKKLVVCNYNHMYIIKFIEDVINSNQFDDMEDAIAYISYYFSNEYFNYNNKYRFVR